MALFRDRVGWVVQLGIVEGFLAGILKHAQSVWVCFYFFELL